MMERWVKKDKIAQTDLIKLWELK
jgi:hypothetical protein